MKEPTLSSETWEKVESITFSSKDFLDTVGYTRASHLITLCPISDGAYRTYILIRGFAMHGQEMTWGLDRLAILRGINRSTLARHLSELGQMGLITRKQRLGTSATTHFSRLEEVFPELAAQCLTAALWKQVRGDDDLRELISQAGVALDPRVSKIVPQVTNNETLSVSEMRQEEEEVKEKKSLLPASKKPQGTEGDINIPKSTRTVAHMPGTDYFTITNEPHEYVDVEEEGQTRPKWQIAENTFQRAFLAVCGAKRFKPRQKTLVKKLSKCIDIGAALSETARLHKCLDDLRDCENFPDKPIAIPESWYAWRREHARSNRWSVQGFINSLFDRDALVRHCQVALKRIGGSAAEETSGEYAARRGLKVYE